MFCNESKRRWKPTGTTSTQPSTANEARSPYRRLFVDRTRPHAREPVEESHGRYYLQSIDTKFISGTLDALRVFWALSSELACAQNRLT